MAQALSFFTTFPRRLGRMMEAARTRAILRTLDDRMLADIGVGPSQALHEADRPFWDLGEAAPRVRTVAHRIPENAALPRSCNG